MKEINSNIINKFTVRIEKAVKYLAQRDLTQMKNLIVDVKSSRQNSLQEMTQREIKLLIGNISKVMRSAGERMIDSLHSEIDTLDYATIAHSTGRGISRSASEIEDTPPTEDTTERTCKKWEQTYNKRFATIAAKNDDPKINKGQQPDVENKSGQGKRSRLS